MSSYKYSDSFEECKRHHNLHLESGRINENILRKYKNIFAPQKNFLKGKWQQKILLSHLKETLKQ